MAKITYANKVALNVNSDIADVNKCNATDLNEIKNVVNNNDDDFNTLNTNVGDLTQLQTTNKNSIVNAINEVNQNDINKSTYSTTEQVVGKWINGKPIYRKVVNATKISGSTLLIPIKELNIDTIFFDRTHSYIVTTSAIVYPFPYNYANTSDTYTACERDGNNIKINSSEGAYSNGQIILVIEYTKTTD